MISLFEVASQDQSVVYLAQVFGNVSVLPSSRVGTLLEIMFKTLNTSALVLGAILVVHTTVMGLIKTASEGEFLGKQWSSLWTPVRMVAGIAALFPTSGGYSIIQVAMMWFIMQGVGAADAMWDTVLKYTAVMGSPYGGVTIPTMQIQNDLPKLFSILTCQANAKLTASQTYTTANGNQNYFYCDQNGDSTFCQRSNTDMLNINGGQNPGAQVKVVSSSSTVTSGGVTFPDQNINYKMGPADANATTGSCGTLAYADYTLKCPSADPTNLMDNIRCAAREAQHKALTDIITAYGIIANDFVNIDSQYMTFYNNQAQSEVPQWIKDYCTAQKPPVSAEQCCVKNMADGGTALGSFSACMNYRSTTAQTFTFPLPYAMKGGETGVPDLTNTSDNAVKNLYWPYGEYTGKTMSQDIKDSMDGKDDMVSWAVNKYVDGITAAVSTVIANQVKNTTLQDWQATASSQGWILAGSYYYRLAQMNNASLTLAIPAMTVAAGGEMGPSAVMSSFRNNYNAVQNIVTITKADQQLSASPQLDQASSSLTSAANGIANSFMTMLTGGSTATESSFNVNPLVALQSFGQTLILSAVIAWTVFLVVATVAIVLSHIDPMVLGSGLTENPAGAAVYFVMTTLYSALVAFIAFCFSLGGLLAVYTPLIPYVIFTFAAIGWFTAVIEAMIATPFIALGILAPGGQSEMFGHANPTIMMLLNIFLRPMLMIMGMMAGMVLAPVVVVMINSGFKAVLGSVAGNTPGPIELILFLVAYAMLIIAALNKCFALIHWIPNHVLTWIGGHATSYGEEDALASIKSGVEAGGKAAGTAMGAPAAVGGLVSGAGEAHKKASDAKAAKGNPPAGGASVGGDKS